MSHFKTENNLLTFSQKNLRDFPLPNTLFYPKEKSLSEALFRNQIIHSGITLKFIA